MKEKKKSSKVAVEGNARVGNKISGDSLTFIFGEIPFWPFIGGKSLKNKMTENTNLAPYII